MTATYHVNGMTCGGCARAVRQAIADAAPAAIVEVDHERGLVRVDGADDSVIKAAVEAAGFDFAGRG